MKFLDELCTRITTVVVVACVRPRAVDVLRERFGRTLTERIFVWAEGDFREIVERTRTGRAIRMRLVVSCAAMSAAIYRTLVVSHVEPAEAAAIVVEIARRTYARLGRIPWSTLRALSLNPFEMFALTVRLFRCLAFDPADYDNVRESVRDDRLSFDVRRCATLELYEELGIPQLCRRVGCDLELSLAEQLQVRLERQGTLADGNVACAMVWSSPAKLDESFNENRPVSEARTALRH